MKKTNELRRTAIGKRIRFQELEEMMGNERLGKDKILKTIQ